MVSSHETATKLGFEAKLWQTADALRTNMDAAEYKKFIEAHAGRLGDISIYGQESNYTTWRLAAMNLAIRGIDAQIAHGDTRFIHGVASGRAAAPSRACRN